MDSKNQSNDMHLLVWVGIFFAWMGYQKYHARVFQFIVDHQFKIVAISIALSLLALLKVIEKLAVKKAAAMKECAILADAPEAVYCGKDSEKKQIFIKPKQRAMHTQVIGTTNAGKTESVILPWAIQDIKDGRGLLLIDGKADKSLLNKLWAYTKKYNREADFKLFSLSNPQFSEAFNPLIGGTPEEITERVFNAFDFENPYYRSLQYEVMSQVMRLFEKNSITPTFEKLHQVINDLGLLEKMAKQTKDDQLITWAKKFNNLSPSERESRTSGLLTAIGHFVFGKTGELFNAEQKMISIDEALNKNQIVYFQLPVLLSPFLGKATGKLVLQSLQAAVANRHRGQGGNPKFYGVFLDDFSEYLYPGFVSILNKSRSANVGVVFAHQALGDITQLGDSVANAILTNSNLKIFMRGNDPDSAEYLSKTIGTKSTTKFTERQKRGFFNTKEKTGDVSARDVEEFLVHPNVFKRELGVGEALMIIPHDGGSKTARIKFDIFDDLPALPLPLVEKEQRIKVEISDPYPEEKEKVSEDLIREIVQIADEQSQFSEVS
ncbi:MAG: hypothetical protein A2504_00550 [Bdellovibrionales bacterium RIFOXYD12_FULL_39_22]|nr:MAG: hypothetical protein A2385_03680 [Bdellovibrionales bacterium RIFOXYB1_FULL_39_21]OFZ44011.1 MAG: hypothetical protein A2485_03195 [Bdellovibrionales bacterium RIFOXYC12_FULL_39_17]OFZ48031.1 MAG: hypothetical protein A2404_01590 [Bdellovibrionales bacterium RIFOXYC1_FULL_39_130]OFZ76495.1 MAG: hypothetical protein A2560_11810 [Bdellovibrionales bacterium RIFOXYD1_FULL_39_84]OFZ95259.1 MAG: hypothetical protein A2504_00550 [Bdellovibrionales bacterium RIFOXYD12_FULL_39_22]HLE11836.1 Tr